MQLREMDGLDDTLGQLSLSAKEWRPGQGFTSTEPARQASADNAASGWNGERRSLAVLILFHASSSSQ